MSYKSILIAGNINHISPRITSYIKVWIEDGIKVTVISPQAKDKDLRARLEAYPSHNFLFINLGYTKSVVEYFQNIANIFLRYVLRSKNNISNLEDKEFTPYPSWARNIILKIIKTICFPDEECEYLYKSYRAIDKINLTNYDLLVTSSPYFSSHVIGKIIKKRCPTLKWIADYRDTFSSNPTYKVPAWRKFIDSSFERWVMSEVDSVVTVSVKYKNILSHTLCEKKKAIIVVPSGYEKSKFERKIFKRECTNEIVISYFGQYFEDYYPGPFAASILSSLNTLLAKNQKKLNIRFYGCTNPIISTLFKDFVTNIYPRIERTEVINKQRHSDINLAFSNGVSDSFGLSHLKLYEYLDAGRPILLITRGVNQDIRELENYYRNFIVMDEISPIEHQNIKINNLYNLVIKVTNNPHNLYIRAPISKSSEVLARKFLK